MKTNRLNPTAKQNADNDFLAELYTATNAKKERSQYKLAYSYNNVIGMKFVYFGRDLYNTGENATKLELMKQLFAFKKEYADLLEKKVNDRGMASSLTIKFTNKPSDYVGENGELVQDVQVEAKLVRHPHSNAKLLVNSADFSEVEAFFQSVLDNN